MGTITQVRTWWLAESGKGPWERPPYSNRTTYAARAGYPQYDGEAWCALAVTAAMKECGVPGVSFYNCPAERNARIRTGQLSDVIRVGMVLFYEFEHDAIVDHTGWVDTVRPDGVFAWEGNTTPDGGGNQADGGGIFRRWRPFSLIRGGFMPAYTPEANTVPSYTINHVDDLANDNGPGGWILDRNGGIFAMFGAPFLGTPFGKDYWGNRQAAELVYPNPAEKAAGKRYVVVAVGGERYAY